jgi:hypothetical protein
MKAAYFQTIQQRGIVIRPSSGGIVEFSVHVTQWQNTFRYQQQRKHADEMPGAFWQATL